MRTGMAGSKAAAIPRLSSAPLLCRYIQTSAGLTSGAFRWRKASSSFAGLRWPVHGTSPRIGGMLPRPACFRRLPSLRSLRKRLDMRAGSVQQRSADLACAPLRNRHFGAKLPYGVSERTALVLAGLCPSCPKTGCQSGIVEGNWDNRPSRRRFLTGWATDTGLKKRQPSAGCI